MAHWITDMDNLQRNMKQINEIKDLRDRLNKQGEEFHLREKELLKAISRANKTIKRRDSRIKGLEDSNKHLRERLG